MGVTGPNLAARLAGVARLPDDATARFKSIAGQTANRIALHARANLLRARAAQKTAASIHVTEDDARKRFTVDVPGDPQRPPMLPVWFEHGTRHMAATPFLRPAGDAEDARYRRDMEQAALDALAKVLR